MKLDLTDHQVNFIQELIELCQNDPIIQKQCESLFKNLLPNSDAFVMFNSECAIIISKIQEQKNSL